ncbi:MAG: hypothetical protein DME26_05100, partial [Verrucomicrobia bacterium]
MRVIAMVLMSAAAFGAAPVWQLPKGYHIEEYAREPRVIDPVAMDWDSQGRLYVLEASGQLKLFAAETKIVLPELLMLDGTNREVLISGLPQPGARGDANSLRFGADGWLYFTQGAQDEAEFYRFGTRAGDPRLISSGVVRIHSETKRIEMVADGMVFPRGLAFNEAGELFAADSSRNHLFQIFTGVSYERPLARDYIGYKPPALGAIADHRFLEGEFFGMTIYRGMVLVPNLHERSIHLERLEPKGSTYR